MTVDPDNKVKTIKDKVFAQKQIKAIGYSLKLDSRALDDEKTIVKENIYPNAELTMDYSRFNITVDIQGKKVQVEADPNDKVMTIKDQINQKEGL